MAIVKVGATIKMAGGVNRPAEVQQPQSWLTRLLNKLRRK